MVPVPDIQGSRAPDALYRRQVQHGRYMVRSWQVEMIEWILDDSSGALLLQFTSLYMKTFSAHLFPYPKFHRPEMYNLVVRLVVTSGAWEDVKDDVIVSIHMTPLSCLYHIREFFVHRGILIHWTEIEFCCHWLIILFGLVDTFSVYLVICVSFYILFI